MAAKKYSKDEIVSFLLGLEKKKHKKEILNNGEIWTDQYNISVQDIINKIINDL